MRSISTTMLIGASVIALTAPVAAVAQSTTSTPVVADGSDTTDQDIIVTARRRDESIQDVPAVINAVTAEEVAKLNFRNFTEVQTIVPGLNLANVANGTGGGATLRGVNFDINASGNNPTVEFYQNDAPITAGVVLQQVFDIGQIEVLRGPQGTLRGRASPSGSITVTTRKPDLYRPGGYVSATANDIGTLNFNGALSIPIIEGVAAIRVAGLLNQDDFDRVRTIKRTIDGRDPYSETQSGRITAVVNPLDALHLEGSFQRYDRRYRGFTQVESFNQVNSAAAASPVLIRPADRLAIEEAPRVVRQKYDIFNGRAELSLFGQKLIYVFQHYNQNVDSVVTQDPADTQPNYDPTQTTISRIRSESHEVRLQNEERVLGTFDYVVGGFDDVNDVPTDLVIQTPVYLPSFLGGGLATTSNSNVGRRGHSHEQSYFGNLTAHLGEKIEVSGGLRYITFKSMGSLILPGPTTLPDAPIDAHHLIYSASANYHFTRDIMLYASTGTSYRPGIDAIGDFSTVQSAREQSFLHLGPETSQSYEAGIKSTFLNGRAHANVSGFHQTFKNYPFRVPGNGIYYLNTSTAVVGGAAINTQSVSQFNFVAAVPVEVNGVEAELGYDVSRNLKFNLVGAYSIGTIKGGTLPCNDLNGDGVPDVITTAPSVAQLTAAYGANNIGTCKVTQRASFQPPFSATLTGEYDHPLTDHVDGYIRGLATYYGASQADPQNTFDNVSSYTLANFYAGIRDPKGAWEVNLFVKNAFDIAKVTAQTNPISSTVQVLQPPTFRTAAAQTTTSTYIGITTTPPREFGLNLRFAFGSR